MTEVYTASTVVDIVDALPTLFGFTPSESFIGITTTGPRRQFGFRLRIDMPDVNEAAKTGDVIAAHLNANAADGVILIALTNDRAKGDAITNAVVDRLGPAEIVAAVRADTHHVWTYDTAGVIDDTDPGLERDTSNVSAAIAQAVAAGVQIWSSRAALAEMFAPSSTLADVSDEVDAVIDGGEVAVEMLTLTATDVITTYAESGGTITDPQINTLAVAAQLISTRDHLWGLITRANAEAHAEAWRHTAIRTNGTQAAGPYALAAFAYWQAGDGARSAIAVDHALDATPGYSMAEHMAVILTAGINPATWGGIPT